MIYTFTTSKGFYRVEINENTGNILKKLTPAIMDTFLSHSEARRKLDVLKLLKTNLKDLSLSECATIANNLWKALNIDLQIRVPKSNTYTELITNQVILSDDAFIYG
jgi:hypothetical protein